MLVSLLAEYKDIAAVGTSYFEGALRYEQVLLAVRASYEYFLPGVTSEELLTFLLLLI